MGRKYKKLRNAGFSHLSAKFMARKANGKKKKTASASARGKQK